MKSTFKYFQTQGFSTSAAFRFLMNRQKVQHFILPAKQKREDCHFICPPKVSFPGVADLCEGAENISKTYGTKIIFVTMGAKGSAYFFKGSFRKQHTFDVKTVDTTGADDAFFGAILYRILSSDKELSELTTSEIDEFMRFANAAGALVTTQKGAIISMPDIEKIEDLVKNGKLL